MPEAVVGNGHTPADLSQIGGPLPILTNTGDQTKDQVALHVFHPTKTYQDPCSLSVCHWCIWLGAGLLTNAYHMTNLAVPPSSGAFTNHYRPRS